jgi:hypothetical protein
MAEVYIVCRAYDYEGSSAMVAFCKREDADSFQKLCADYQAERPRFPENHDDDGVYDGYCEADTKWRKEHPAGEYAASADSFHVETVELR